MNEILKFSIDEVVPERDPVFENQGIPPGTDVQGEVETLWSNALGLFKEFARPVGKLSTVSKPEFTVVYRGAGWNEPHTPVGDIFPHAADLALFAVTLGERIGQEIKDRFKAKDFALGSMLDATASVGADRAAEAAVRRFFEILSKEDKTTPDTGLLPYSPGYCGWDITGQAKLFEYLRPADIGINLNDSSLMQPLKSVSGVIIAGPKEIHNFRNAYPLCSQCDTQGCRRRIRKLLAS